MDRKKTTIFVVALGVGLAGITWAQAQASDVDTPLRSTAGFRTTGDGPPVRFYSPSSLSAASPTDPREPGAILEDVLARYGGHAIISARFGGPTPGWTGNEDPKAPLPPHLADGRWLYATVTANASGAQSVRSIWEANLVAGAVRDRLRMAGVDGDLIASNVHVRLPDGTVIPYAGGGMGRVAFMQSFSNASSESIEISLRAAAAGLGMDVLSVSVLRPLQAAPAIVVSVKDPREFVANAGAIVPTVLGGKTIYEGAYFEARDAVGNAVFISATDFRTGVGMQWVRRDLNPRFQASLGGG